MYNALKGRRSPIYKQSNAMETLPWSNRVPETLYGTGVGWRW